MKANTENPFYHNYIFSRFDINRVKIRWHQYPWLFFLTTYVQVSEGYVFKFKQWRNRYYVIGFEELTWIKELK